MRRHPLARRLAVALLTVAIAVGAAAVATAQDPAAPDVRDTWDSIQDAPQSNHDLGNGLTGPDTDNTPYAKEEGSEWQQVAGALFPASEGADPAKLVKDSFTSYDDNLYDVDFAHGQLGLAGGSTCQGSDPDHESGCTPVLYAYTDTPENGKEWKKVDLPHSGEPGFVGAIAWLDESTAMAVGGTGTFPRRAPPYGKDIKGNPCPPPAPDSTEPYGANCDQAGTARAWLFREGNWCELDRDGDCPALPRDDEGARPRGLTAVDFKGGQEPADLLGFVGGLGQIWRWQGAVDGGGFDKLYDNDSPRSELNQARFSQETDPQPRFFRFRIRDIRFTPTSALRALAVSDGCCSRYDTTDRPLLFTYSEKSDSSVPIPPQWFVGQAPGTVSSDPNQQVDSANDALQGADAGVGRPLPRPREHGHQSGGTSIDSYYSLATGPPASDSVFGTAAILATTASTDSEVESRSVIQNCRAGSYQNTGSDPSEASLALTTLSTARLVAIDGTVTSVNTSNNLGCIPDWAVGELRSRYKAGHGRRGLAVHTRTPARTPPAHDLPPFAVAPNLLVPATYADAVSGFGAETASRAQKGARYTPTSKEMIEANLRSFDYLMSSYTLNSVEMIGQTGSGWAVGDHGAIAQLGDEEGGGSDGGNAEPVPPRLGSRAPKPLPDQGALGNPPSADSAAGLPSLRQRPVKRLDRPRLVSAGSPDATHLPSNPRIETEDVGQIVMSRDGTEGWAIGPNARTGAQNAFSPFDYSMGSSLDYGVASFYHYDGSTWSRCDPVGIAGQLEPDPACASVKGLRRFTKAGTSFPTRLFSLARVPLENDGDPSNDDEFELVAVGTQYKDRERHGIDYDPVILRYRDGRWDFEEPKAREAVTSRVEIPPPGSPRSAEMLILYDVAFTAPDDGWALGRRWLQQPAQDNELYHFDGRRWWRCRLADPDSTIYRADDPDLADCGSSRLPSTRADSQLRLISAGERVYIYGKRPAASGLPQNSAQPVPGTRLPDPSNLSTAPFILYHERGGEWTDGGDAGGGLDPGWNNPASPLKGVIRSLSVAQNPDGSYSGWAVGRFYTGDVSAEVLNGDAGTTVIPPKALLLRLDSKGGWELFRDPGALEDHLSPRPGAPLSERSMTEPHQHATLPGEDGRSLVAQAESGRLYEFDPKLERWGMAIADRPPDPAGLSEHEVNGLYQAIAPDGRGGFWAAVKNLNEDNQWSGGNQVWFFHYTSEPPEDVFEETAQPFGDRPVRLTSLAGAPDGSLWATTSSSTIARYDRIGGWKQTTIPGWDPGRVVTASSEVNAVAVGADGSGVAVGKAGRIAKLTPTSIGLDAAASVLCNAGDRVPGCGTTRDLRAAAVEPNGSALVGGDAMATLWRAPGASFQRLPSPPGGSNANITGIAMPRPDRAWITTDTGFVVSGEMSAPGVWRWKNGENKITSGEFKGKVLGSIDAETNLPLRAIALNDDLEGYAVGDRGLVLRRTGNAEQPWKRIRPPGTDDLTSVSLGPGSDNAIIGGKNGLVLTASGDELEVARPAGYRRGGSANDTPSSPYGPLTGPVVGTALLPGTEDGEAEAWVAIQERGSGTNRLLHYASDPENPLLNPDHRAGVLPDSLPSREGELAFAAFGKADCDSQRFCPEMLGTSETAEVTNQRIVSSLKEASGKGAIQFSLFTGDATDSAGQAGASVVDLDKVAYPYVPGSPDAAVGALKHRRFNELVADPLRNSEVPFFGAIGSGDLSRPIYNCPKSSEDDPQGNINCRAYGPEEQAKTGDNMAWREGLEGQASPWGKGGDAKSAQNVEFKAASGSDDHAEAVQDATVDPDGADQQLVRPVEIHGGARTHYAADVIRNGKAVARIVTIDSSLRSLTAADGAQQPLEKRATGQLSWLEQMLCFEGQTTPEGDKCSRERDQQAIVLSNTPTYSYGPAAPEATETDGTVLEALFFKYRVNAVVQGRLGWNGLYYGLAPGLHAPCVGDAYPERAPDPRSKLCSSVTSGLPVADPTGEAPDPNALVEDAKKTTGVQVPCDQVQLPVACDDTAGITGWMVPFVVASGAGGKFGPNGDLDGSASDGYWHGYTIVRLSPDGDPAKTVVEQRPILDWISIRGTAHVLRPGQKTELRGIGREPIGFSLDSNSSTTRYDDISTAAITHRYDLLYADPEKPWLPKVDEDSEFPHHYVPVENSDCAVPGNHPVGCINRQSGKVQAGSGSQERTYTLAMLSVGEKVATWPLVFEPRPSFSVEPPLPPPPAPPPPPPPPPAAQPPGQVPTLNLPTPPALPSLPIGAELAPPQPPVPPPPPGAASVAPLNLFLSTPGINIAPQSTVVPPPAPPIQPAPPGGARKEARQRQAAAQKSGSDSGEGAETPGDTLADAPYSGDQAMTRRAAPETGRDSYDFSRSERTPPGQSFTTLSARRSDGEGPALLYIGGVTLLALTLAIGFRHGRPTPRRRTPELPAPAWARSRRR